MIEPVDARILHAIQLAPRAPFRTIADVVGMSEQLVARRFHRLHRDGVVRVVGLRDHHATDEAQWVVRVRAKPDDLRRIAGALVRRPDVTHANVHSNWTELVCLVRAPVHDDGDGLLQRLPRTTTVLDLDIDVILHVFGAPSTAPWRGYGAGLGAEAWDALSPQVVSADDGPRVVPTEDDRALFDALAEDGRAPHSRLARATGWSPARVARRMGALEASGALTYDVDLLPERLGFGVNAMIWLTVAPEHLDAVGEAIAAHPEVASATAISGRDNVMAIAICRDIPALYRYLSDRLAEVPNVDGYRTSIRTERLKQTASVVSHGRLIASSR